MHNFDFYFDFMSPIHFDYSGIWEPGKFTHIFGVKFYSAFEQPIAEEILSRTRHAIAIAVPQF